MAKKILDTMSINQIAKEVTNISVQTILSSQQSLQTFIAQGLALIAAGKKSTETNEQLMNSITSLFNIVVKLREYFTGEKYYLMVETKESGTIGISLEELYAQGAIQTNDNKIQYNLAILNTEVKKIEIYEQVYKNLIERLFPQSENDHSLKETFIYQHSKKNQSTGHFFDKNFAHYPAQNSYMYHFYINERKKDIIYNRQTAKFYNRGHVYEWYLDDLNKDLVKGNANINPVSFMQRHKKDTVPFIQAGDITVQKGEQIYAVQIKRFNNHKLMTYSQIERVLRSLKNIISPQTTQEKLQEVIEKTFLSNQEPIQAQTQLEVNRKVKEIAKSWKLLNSSTIVLDS